MARRAYEPRPACYRSDVDPKAHRRFLEYQELWTVFGRDDRKKLDRASWESLDAEHEALLARAAEAELHAAAQARLARLRHALLRD